jgi:hypothetical protein
MHNAQPAWLLLIVLLSRSNLSWHGLTHYGRLSHGYGDLPFQLMQLRTLSSPGPDCAYRAVEPFSICCIDSSTMAGFCCGDLPAQLLQLRKAQQSSS